MNSESEITVNCKNRLICTKATNDKLCDQSVQIEAENERLNGELGLVNTKLKRLEIELRLVLIAAS